MDDYGIYTAADANFFPGVVVQINALRLHGYLGPLAVIDTGLEPWMRDYLRGRGAIIIATDFFRRLRFTDVLSDELVGMRGWSFKAFGITEARLFRCFTYLDADYVPLCDMRRELFDRVRRGEFLCTEDGANTWDERHAEAVGVPPGRYTNVNAGFFSASLDHHGAVIEEWRNLMTRRKPFDLWYGDQGALNAILDKYGVPKVLVGDKADWNQTWLNEELARGDAVVVESRRPPVLRHRDGRRVYGWHGCGWYRYWHCIGIDHYRSDPGEVERFRLECQGKVPQAVLDAFTSMLFLDDDLVVTGHRIGPRPGGPTPLADLYHASYESLTDKGTAHSYVDVYERLLAPLREREGVRVLEIGVWQGGSLLLWDAYFRSARITGVDVDLSRVLPEARHSPRISLVRGDAADAGRLLAADASPLDVVIDDGSHVIDEQLAAFRSLAGRLAPGGLYVIEDVWPIENARRLAREIPGAEVVDRRHVKGRADDVLVVYCVPG
jgi:hypothetical protein